jgi:MFS family permease
VGRFGPILSPLAIPLITEFQIDFTKFALLSGYNLLATGALGIFMAALCRKYGKRPGLIFSMFCAVVGSIWAAAAHSYGSFLGARMVQGLSMSFFESVVFAAIGDLYFVHERGTRMAVYVAMFSGIANLPVLIAGKIAESLGWRWIFWLLAIFIGLVAVLVIMFGWETAFNRDAIYNVDSSSHEVLRQLRLYIWAL